MVGKSWAVRRPLPPRREGRAADEALMARRLGAPPNRALESREQVIGGVMCRVVGEPVPGGAIVIHLHGGGYRMGAPKDWVEFGHRLVAVTGAQVILPDYSLAPEKPFPNAIHDVIDILEELTGKAEETPIILSGDSAGGGLALATAGALTTPSALAGLILISPWLDLRIIADSYQRCAGTDPLFSSASAAASAADYLQGWSADDPLASPLLGELDGLPPVCLFASSAEVLADDSISLAQRLSLNGTPITSVIFPDLLHDWPVMDPQRPETAMFFEVVKTFSRQIFGLIK